VISHGHSRRGKRSITYRAWAYMWQRCTNPKDQDFNRYGGRGIKVCSRWCKFENFLIDMGEKPVGLTLDRINNNRGYCKQNCRWTTAKVQANNRRTNRILEFGGKKLSVSQWASEIGISYNLIRNRLAKGWPTDRILSTPRLVYWSRRK